MSAVERPVTAKRMRELLGRDDHGQLIGARTFRRWWETGTIPSYLDVDTGTRWFVPSQVADALRALPSNGATRAAS